MQIFIKTVKPFLGFFILALAATSLLNGCQSSNHQSYQPINIDGSSTVYPITKTAADRFNETQSVPVEVTVGFSGTGGGFKKFCAGKTEVNNASRPISLSEMEACKQAKVSYIELPIAFDAITVVVNPQNNWIENITIDELRKIWQPEAQQKITRWNQIRSSWPNAPLKLYGPGTDSGTYDYFTEAVTGSAGSSRSDYIASEDDRLLEQQVSSDVNSLGYFGLAYYEQNKDELKALSVDSGQGPVFPSRETVEKSEYQPLARPLFIYINLTAAQNNPAMREFVYYFLEQAPGIAEEVGYVPLPEEAYHINEVTYNQGEVGTVFEGQSQFGLSISELMRKQAKY
ncbi:MAG: PstS family phosphate ABC transporter substrate-binding protein [Roseofilum sp. SBFL]|uniref:PstS family phosphate ABC transporter substrate-binding protein n=1 Tax=unclassified Roseofilum TaxID=2620099 RepID=UPI001B23DC1D|nr:MULTISPECIES: PstS family phosphate ABC transporter substrate-binding protein [unclassified Roseofilum]MBP0012376.1 PstS family phosphate ABC transporter substrate-binding protein [Roseofilum sp. SID3]MBP0026624.1 PstS family phosphate ABC transporter substrate-binding protein [Roseofilum sp. SID2]MBP0042382.1 PstS family phosphate ABC transporter substrate-binding protein [Roseofilum sp. SBFL]